ncbi:unnamed protein product [Cuscuta campestris]|uniref:HMG box domain-containing protein n=1 Tax=Cuscuta campestris TaxID=132261 RepID=A0A484NEG7_9ASTE|nr:unnamed protein product [Cuscuta campestris]
MKGGKSKAKADNKLAVKKNAPAVKKSAKATKAAKDPNKPKRPSSAFFVFMEDFRKSYKSKNPNNKAVSEVGKAGGAKWKQLSDAEKAPYVAEAEKRKKKYEKDIKEYDRRQAEGPAEEDEESDKSKSEVNDEDGDDDDDESGEVCNFDLLCFK